MTRGNVALPLLLLLAVGCGSSGSPVTAPSPSPSPTVSSPSPRVLSAADVKAAATDVRASGTASYEYSLTITAAGEQISTSHTGYVDLAARRQTSTTRFDATPRLAEVLTGGGPSLDQMTTRIITDRDVMYLQMEAWPAPQKGRWLRITKADLEDETGSEFSADSLATVPLLDVLAGVTTGVPRPGEIVELTVPVADVLASAPSRLVTALADMGVDLERLDGSVVAEAWLERGLPAVRIELVDEVKRLVPPTGKSSAFANAITSLVVKMTVTSEGVPYPDMTPPPANLVMTPEEMDAGTG